MNPTEHELTVATEAIARTVYDLNLKPFQPVRDFADLEPIERHGLLEAALPLAVAALDAIPDRAEAIVQRVEAHACACHTGDSEHDDWCPAAAIVAELRA